MPAIKVCIRLRPLNESELEASAKHNFSLDVSGRTLWIKNPFKQLSVVESQGLSTNRVEGFNFTFDRVFDSTDGNANHFADQNTIFHHIGRNVVDDVIKGYNCSIFAYGQTGSGKTYTMFGPYDGPSESRGLTPRVCANLFEKLALLQTNEPENVIRLEISYLEIYNEKVRDLLKPAVMHTDAKKHKLRKRPQLKIRMSPKEGPYVEGLTRHIVSQMSALEELLDKGNDERMTAATHVHEHSSRSHAIFTVYLTQAKMDPVTNLPSETHSKISFVDLAGSERADPTSTYNRERFKEGVNINKSLVALGGVINALAEQSQQKRSEAERNKSRAQSARQVHIPYRESILTFLLKDSLGGNAITTMIATISAASNMYHETISTLRYASRTQVIENRPQVNEDPQVVLIKTLKAEVEALRKQIRSNNRPNVVNSSTQVILDRVEEEENKITSMTEAWNESWQKTKTLLEELSMGINRADDSGVLLTGDCPHLVGFSHESSVNLGTVIYPLKEGETFVGTVDSSPDIVITGPNTLEEHCHLRNVDGFVTLVPNKGAMCFVNTSPLTSSIALYHGCLLQLGFSNIFLYSNKNQRASSEAWEYGPLYSPVHENVVERTASVISFQSVDMDDGVSLQSRERSGFKRFASDPRLYQKLEAANQQIHLLNEERAAQESRELEREQYLNELRAEYNEEISQQQKKIEELLQQNEVFKNELEKAVDDLKAQYNRRMNSEKILIDEEIQTAERKSNEIRNRKKNAKTQHNRNKVENELVDAEHNLRRLRERERRISDNLRSIEHRIREKERTTERKTRIIEQKLADEERHLHKIKAEYLDQHMKAMEQRKSSLSFSNYSKRLPRSESTGDVFERLYPGGSDQKFGFLKARSRPNLFDPGDEESNHSRLYHRHLLMRKSPRRVSEGKLGMEVITLKEEDGEVTRESVMPAEVEETADGKTFIRFQLDNKDEMEDSNLKDNDVLKREPKMKKQRPISLNFDDSASQSQKDVLKGSLGNLTQLPLDHGRSIMIANFLEDSCRSVGGWGSMDQVPNDVIIEVFYAGVSQLSPMSSVSTFDSHELQHANEIIHEVNLPPRGPLYITKPLSVHSRQVRNNSRTEHNPSDYGSMTTTTGTQFSSLDDDSEVDKQNIAKDLLKNNISNSNGDLVACPVQVSKVPLRIEQDAGQTASFGPDVTLTITPSVTVTAIPGSLSSSNENLSDSSSAPIKVRFKPINTGRGSAPTLLLGSAKQRFEMKPSAVPFHQSKFKSLSRDNISGSFQQNKQRRIYSTSGFTEQPNFLAEAAVFRRSRLLNGVHVVTTDRQLTAQLETAAPASRRRCCSWPDVTIDFYESNPTDFENDEVALGTEWSNYRTSMEKFVSNVDESTSFPKMYAQRLVSEKISAEVVSVKKPIRYFNKVTIYPKSEKQDAESQTPRTQIKNIKFYRRNAFFIPLNPEVQINTRESYIHKTLVNCNQTAHYWRSTLFNRPYHLYRTLYISNDNLVEHFSSIVKKQSTSKVAHAISDLKIGAHDGILDDSPNCLQLEPDITRSTVSEPIIQPAYRISHASKNKLWRTLSDDEQCSDVDDINVENPCANFESPQSLYKEKMLEIECKTDFDLLSNEQSSEISDNEELFIELPNDVSDDTMQEILNALADEDLCEELFGISDYCLSQSSDSDDEILCTKPTTLCVNVNIQGFSSFDDALLTSQDYLHEFDRHSVPIAPALTVS